MPNLFQGKVVLYRWRPGQVRAGQIDAAAVVLKVNEHNSTVDLMVLPAGAHEPLYQDSVSQMSDKVLGHCWHFNLDDEYIDGLEQRVSALEEALRAKRKAA